MKHDQKAFEGALSYSAATREEVEDRVRRFLPLVHHAAWHIYGDGRHAGGLEVEDLIQVGLVALTECARNHEGPGEDGFAAYAKIRVRGAIVDELRKLASDTRTARKKRARLAKVTETLRAETGAEPSRSEVAAAMGINDAELRSIEASSVSITSINDEYDESNSAFAADDPDPFDILAGQQDRERLIAAMQELPQRSQLVLQLFFVEELNLTEIASVLEVSVPRVHQLRAKALKDLRALLTAS